MAKKHSGANPFLFLAYLIVGIAVLGCFTVFGYQLYLESVANKKGNDVAAAQAKIDQATVTEFIRLRDRFTAAKGLLNNHPALSQFFDVLEKHTLAGVRFVNLKVSVTDDRTATVEATGIARTFNTLAAQSSAFAEDKRIKRAIFSGITVNPKDNTVSFSIRADLDPTLILIPVGGPVDAGTAVIENTPTPTPAPAASTTPPFIKTGTTATTTP